jgi:hypothetical protein
MTPQEDSAVSAASGLHKAENLEWTEALPKNLFHCGVWVTDSAEL